MANTKIVVNVNLELDTKQIEKLVKKQGANVGQELGGLASWILGSLADGGQLMPEKAVNRIHAALGNFTWPDGVVQAVERSKHKSGDTTVVEIPIDPTYLPFYEEQARQQGRTVKELWKDIIDWAHEQDWLYTQLPPMRRLVFTKEAFQEVADVIDKVPDEVTGADIVELVRQLSGVPVKG